MISVLRKNRRLMLIMLSAASLLLIPLAGMVVSSQVNWTVFDFLIAGVLLFGSGLSIELILRKVKSRTLRLWICLLVMILMLLAWMELAVGVFGSPFAGS